MHVDRLHHQIFHAECWEFRPLCDNYKVNAFFFIFVFTILLTKLLLERERRRSKFLTIRVDLFFRGEAKVLTRVISPESVFIPLKQNI